MRIIRLGRIILIILTMVVGWFLISKGQKGDNRDFKLGVAADDGLALISVSWERRMVNIMLVDKDREVWIPEGLGWYKSSKVKKLLLQEDKWETFDKVLFYNYGFVADRIIGLERVSDWDNFRLLIKEMGVTGWIKYKLNSSQMVTKEEKVDLETSEEALDEIMIRDFSDSSLMTDETRLRVINLTEEDGLAGFIGKNLERAGISVVGIENARGEDVKSCFWLFKEKPGNGLSAEIVRRMLGCEESQDKNLSESEWELYLGADWARVVKYSSYVRSF
jgi:hypothetical protein